MIVIIGDRYTIVSSAGAGDEQGTSAFKDSFQ